MKRSYIVTIDCDNSSSVRVRQYIKEAVQLWGGFYHPDDSLYSGILRKPGKVTVDSTQVPENRK